MTLAGWRLCGMGVGYYVVEYGTWPVPRRSLSSSSGTGMAPRLEPWQHELIRDMIQDREPFTNAQIAEAVRCTPRSIRAIRSNLRCFGNVRAPANGIGRRRSITPPMLEALREHLSEKPDLY
ncbi:hypothetical protein PENSOL_c082G00325 [Penicillium solitum]|uniref:Transposase Tc1-like domain-containing protein n=1 Tax=Penicillium solitum TaxID=60172 RepID=A0A1V6QCI3_9EURO|nr:uncharacterized protein PENSOL_c082G00325 [Penicillium solitum]OQD86919.1 hypothetical protein PENSOL_c082G00325 [Penicillium solitum]